MRPSLKSPTKTQDALMEGKGPVIICVGGGGWEKNMGAKAILNEQRGGGLLCFSGIKIRWSHMIQQDL